ncbi:MOSC domain-containing protein [Streptacidiphilus melanogenes]|uniref:MOSC domain-containing protein n=1 Tax=Streptacidiphilus melanogenes TaxID=411235 RepID=UPI0005A868B6|nr:MOSC domain-containing protein [Streptacidiphilus melanogenes]
MGTLLSVNVGRPEPTVHSDPGVTAIGKKPVDGPVRVTAPTEHKGVSGLAGDAICDVRHHGGVDQAVYAYAREELDAWAEELGRELPNGMFGENLTTTGLRVSDALIGERWQIGETLLLEVSATRIPCRTFAGWMERERWVKTFTDRARPGAYLRVLTPGEIRAGDAVTVVHRPDHGVSSADVFRALHSRAREVLPLMLNLPGLAEDHRDAAARRLNA